MATPILHDMKLVGTNASGGGSFRHIKITGESLISGDVQCESLSCTGELEIKGNLTTGKMKITGECRIEGSVQADQIKSTGELDVQSLRGGQVKITGQIKTTTSCEAESFHLHGWCDVGGLISAEKLRMELHGPCKAQEIGGGVIHIKQSSFSKIKNLLSPKDAGTLQANLIEGDVVNLENTTAEVVRGTRITIGPGCQIGRIEYRESLEQHPKAEIGSVARI